MNLDGNKASINEAIDAGLLSGAVTLVWQAGEVLQVNELGYRDVEAGLPMQRDTMFRIASMTKPVTVAAAMTLVDEGRLALTDPVDEVAAGTVRSAGDGRCPRLAGRHRSRRAADHHRRPDDPPQRLRVRVLGARPAGPRVRQAVAPAGPGQLAGGSGRSFRWRISPARG